jgi:ATP-binding cassette subfamily B (MDR/TAP) protein 1
MAQVVPEQPAAEGQPARALSYHKLYRYATPLDWLLVFFGLIGAVCSGLTMPAFTRIFGQVVTAFGDGSGTQEINAIALKFLYVALATAVASYLQNAMFMLAGARLKPGHGCCACSCESACKIPQFAHSAANIQTIVSTCFVS